MSFVDFYETLELSPHASADTIERVFRHLARRFHPDNRETGDRDRFDLISEAHSVLRDQAKRARYDLAYWDRVNMARQPADAAPDPYGLGSDVETQTRLLSLFYVQCRKNVREPGFSEGELSVLLDCDSERLEFHLWYMRGKQWIARKEDGRLAITIEGVDRASSEEHIRAARKLITDQT